jgi:phospholipid transport system substrate-binding protein
MKMKKILMFLILIFVLTMNLFAATPEQVVKKMVNAIKLKKYGTELSEADLAHNLKMTQIAATCFDLETMAQTALSDHWVKIDTTTQQTLITKIKDLVIKLAYPASNPDVQKIQIVYKGQQVKQNEAAVYSLLIVKNKELKVDYILHNKNGNWLVYDILSEGRSLIDDYKAQFNKVIDLYSVEKLVEILDKKLEGK